MIKPVDFYIDLGTAHTLIYAKGIGFVLNEPSVLAMKKKNEGFADVFATGHRAKLMLGREPENLKILRPLREGVISDFESTGRMLYTFLSRVKEQTAWIKPKLIISLPCEVTQFERRAVEEVGYQLGARKVQLLDEPVAAAVGAGLPILENFGHMIVDIGGGTTEIAILSVGGIVASQAIRVGGDAIDEAIIRRMLDIYHFKIGEQTAEKIKIQVGSALLPISQAKEMYVGGFNLEKGLPERFKVTAEMVYPAIDGVIRDYIKGIFKTLENCPPEIAGDIAHNGLVLAGGGALLSGLRERISRETGLAVHVAPEPLMSVARGGAKALEDAELFEQIQRPA